MNGGKWLMISSFLLLFTTFGSSVDGKVNIRHSHFNKLLLQQLDEGTYEVVHPFQVRDRKERIGIDTRNYFLNASTHYKQVVIIIRGNSVISVRLKLILTLNDYLFFDKTQFKKLDYDGEDQLGTPVENCYYQGTVNGDASTFVALSTCNGLWGLISFNNGTTLGIWPLDGGDRGRRHPHVLYLTRWAKDGICGALTQITQQPLNIHNIRPKREMALSNNRKRQTRFLKLAVIGDYEFMKEFNLTDNEGIDYIMNAMNIADLILYNGFGIRVSIVYAELWLDSQRIEVSSELQQTLTAALDYVTTNIYHVEKDGSLLFSGGLFSNGEVLTATFSSVCTSRALGVVKTTDPYTSHTAGVYASHVLGHILGIDHDSSECTCEYHERAFFLVPSPVLEHKETMKQHCIMSQQISFADAAINTYFSRCSVARLQSLFSQSAEHLKCMLIRPFQPSILYQCGNGIVDDGEECDCGEQCDDPCCDAFTCTLKPHAKCASHQQCCHRCEVRPAGHICRVSSSSCDIAEVCDGRSGECPTDRHLIDGVFCGVNGHCWQGDCLDREQQCRELWGPESKPADHLCFTYNQKAVEYGNCGRDEANKTFLPCSNENIRCGTLHCTDGSSSPILSNLTSFNLQFPHDTQQIQCKVVTGSKRGMVKDGTECGNDSVCIDSACLPLSQVSAPVQCPSNNLALQCSGHGDCTTTQTCLCFDGWTGVACDIRLNVTRTHKSMHNFIASKPGIEFVMPSFRVNGKPLETATLLGILILVGLMLLLLLVCLLLFYRRKSSAGLYRNASTNKVVDEDDSMNCVGDGNRAIKFGQMPSYREEKRKRRRNKLVYDALQRITEANEERDSGSSQKSRESSLVNAQQQHQNCGGTNHHATASIDNNSIASSNNEKNSSLRGSTEVVLLGADNNNANHFCINNNAASEGGEGYSSFIRTTQNIPVGDYQQLRQHQNYVKKNNRKRLELERRDDCRNDVGGLVNTSFSGSRSNQLDQLLAVDGQLQHHQHHHHNPRGFTPPPLVPPLLCHNRRLNGGGTVSPSHSDFYAFHNGTETRQNARYLNNTFGGGGGTFSRSGYSTDTELTLLRNELNTSSSALRRYNPTLKQQQLQLNSHPATATTTASSNFINDERPNFEPDAEDAYDDDAIMAPPTSLRLNDFHELMQRLNSNTGAALHVPSRQELGGERLVVEPQQQHQRQFNKNFGGSQGDFDRFGAANPYDCDFSPVIPPTSATAMLGGGGLSSILQLAGDLQHPPSAPSADSGHPGSSGSTFDVRDSPSGATTFFADIYSGANGNSANNKCDLSNA